jgi:electron transfer flavoprotein beta subunit
MDYIASKVIERMANTDMKILVCVKQVADPEGTVTADGGRVVYDQHPAWRMNRYDEYALEEALKIRDASPLAAVTAISVGPPRVATALRRSLEMGAGQGIHILTGDEDILDPFQIASLIALHAENEDYDLILCGVMSEDDMNGQVGPMVAARLGYACATAVLGLTVDEPTKTVTAEREIDQLTREVVALALPAVITMQSGVNRPRYPSLSHVLRARSQDLSLVAATGTPASSVATIGYDVPSASRAGLIIEGSEAEKAERLVSYLHGRGLC